MFTPTAYRFSNLAYLAYVVPKRTLSFPRIQRGDAQIQRGLKPILL